MSLEKNTAEFWDAVAANIEWESLELNDGHQLRVIIPCMNGKRYKFDYWPKKRQITLVGSKKVHLVWIGATVEHWIKNYIKKNLKTVAVKKFKAVTQ